MDTRENFDWVTRRSECSSFNVLKQLQMGADDDVKKRNGLRIDVADINFKMVPSDNSFSVQRIGRNLSASVEFTCTDKGICAKSGGLIVVDGRLTLNDSGECRLKVGSDELSCCQFRRRALEDLFFGS